MSELMRVELVHKSPLMQKDEFIREIDRTGGWPAGFKFVSFFHAIEHKNRQCKFTNEHLRDGNWTTVCSADDYYASKISDEKKHELLNKARQQLISQLV